MNVLNSVFILFILGTFAIGTAVHNAEADISVVHNALDNASVTITELELSKDSDNPFVVSILKIVEKFIHYIGTYAFELFRMGAIFGYENPDYLEPSFVFKIIKLIVYLIIISLLIKPVMYLIIGIVMLAIWINDLLERGRKRKELKEKRIKENPSKQKQKPKDKSEVNDE